MMPSKKGAIRLRSNIVVAGRPHGESVQADDRSSDDWWELVPGDLVGRYKPHFLNRAGASRRQRQEKGYYIECAYCRRLSHEISLDGCAEPGCHPPSAEEVRRARERRADALAAIEHEMAIIRQIELDSARGGKDPA